MGAHRITLAWSKGDAPFTYDAYSRNHRITFKERETVTFSASAAYRGDAGKADPEDAFVAALSSCHLLSFLAIAAKKKLTVESYEDDAVGLLEKQGGKLWMAVVTLRPKVAINADAATLAEIHHLAHQACFIANSVKTDVRLEPR